MLRRLTLSCALIALATPVWAGPFDAPSALPLQAPDFATIKDSDYQPAMEEGMRQELADTRTELNELSAELQERKVIDRAKGILMQRQGLSEEDAYRRLRKAAMDKGLKLAEVAQRILDVAELLG